MEAAALMRVLTALDGLSPEGLVRVLETAATFYGLSAKVTQPGGEMPSRWKFPVVEALDRSGMTDSDREDVDVQIKEAIVESVRWREGLMRRAKCKGPEARKQAMLECVLEEEKLAGELQRIEDSVRKKGLIT